MSVLVFLEQRDGQIRPLAREVLGEATRLAAGLGGPVVGVCAAAADPGLASLGESGAERVLLAQHAAFSRYDAAGYARAVAVAVESVKPAAVLFGASAMGKDLAPRVAARLGVGRPGPRWRARPGLPGVHAPTRLPPGRDHAPMPPLWPGGAARQALPAVRLGSDPLPRWRDRAPGARGPRPVPGPARCPARSGCGGAARRGSSSP